MLTQTDAPPGPNWMRNASGWIASMHARPRRSHLFWVWLGVYLLVLLAAGLLVSAAPSHPYESSARIGDLPFLSFGTRAHGVIAVGEIATGGIAVGNVAVGAIAIGGCAVGGIAIGGLGLGMLAIGGLAVGGYAVGGGAVGYAALGGFAVGGHAYAGNGVALGVYSADGRQVEHLLTAPRSERY